MANENRTITDFIDTEVKEYAISVVEERAIPSIVDGFKPVQRKIVFTASKVARSFIKTAALVGNVISIGGYYKGDASIGAACSKMAQEFAGSNNFAFIAGEGEFGKRLTPNGIAAPRYTKAKLHPNFSKFFVDSELLEYFEQDGEYFEPRYYLPSIPTVLLNGVAGIAVGFAVEINPYNVKDIIFNVSQVLAGKPQKEMIPYWEGFKGTVTKEEDGSIVQRGVWRKVNSSTIEITELPIGMSRDKYVEHLNKLEENGDIKSYDDLCKKEFNFVIYVKREDLVKWEEEGKIEQKFKLRQKLSENINLISEHGKLIYFNDVNEVIEYFVKFRMSVMTKRKEFFQKLHSEKIKFGELKIEFLKKMMAGEIDFKKMKSKADMKEKVQMMMQEFDPSDEDLERLIGIALYNVTKEEIASLEEKNKEHEKQREYYETTPEKKLFIEDLKSLVKNLGVK